MEVIESKHLEWFLLKHEDEYYIDVYCSSGFASFSAVVQLNTSEKASYCAHGVIFIESLAEAITSKAQYNHPRNIKEQGLLSLVHESIKVWKKDKT
ncbi:hypothetical protein [Vibrio coralliilyticus]|uniref:hypothetical protein n=1 Tax=Vibrio coralliilyticus TaxID=190893 RepID=UPI001E3955F6|nr:hypothetical protein [Vibrio coralliilyticus]MCC2525736.1 hypothetical protein [Vibrio coralliilyticus]